LILLLYTSNHLLNDGNTLPARVKVMSEEKRITTRIALEMGAKLKDLSYHIMNFEIPNWNKPLIRIELRRSFDREAEFIVIENDGEPIVIDQDDKAEWLKSICERLFLSFGCYKPSIMWAGELDEYFYNRVINTDLDILKKWKEDHPKEDNLSTGLGSLFG